MDSQGVYIPNNSEKSGQDDSLDILRYLHILVIHKWEFIIVMLLVLGLALIYAYTQPDYYKATYEIYYSESAQQFLESDLPVLETYFDKNYWLSVMHSNEVAYRTLENSGLALTAAEIRGMLRVQMEDRQWSMLPSKYIVTITTEHNEFIPIIFKAFVQSLNEMLINHQVDFSKNLVNYLNDQLEDNYRKLGRIDRNILMQQATNPYLVRDISQLATDLEKFRTDMQNTRIELATVRASKQRTEDELTNIDPTIFSEMAYSEPLKVQLMNLQVDLARALTRNQEDHPRVRAIRENISLINNMLRDNIEQTTEITSIAQNPLERQLMGKLMDFYISEIALETRYNSLAQVIGEIEGKMLPDTTDIENQQLVRNRELVFMTIDKLNSKLIDVQSAAHGGLFSFLYIDEPQVPMVPANRALSYYLMLGLILGVGAGAGGVFLYDFLDNRIMLLNDFQKFYRQPVLGTLPYKKKASDYFMNLYNTEASYHHKSEANEIIFFIRQLIRRQGKKVISVCSPLRGEGKSLISLQLALGLADRNMRVLLVDMDLFAPKLTSQLNGNGHLKKSDPLIENGTIKVEDLIGRVFKDVGLADYLRGDASFTSTLRATEIPNLYFVSIGKMHSISEFCVDNEKFLDFVDWARESFDAVIFDTPALMFLPELVCFMEYVDTVLPVARLRHTTRHSFDKMLRMVKAHHGKIDGVIVNDVRSLPLKKYGYYYGYYDYKKSYKDKETESLLA